MSALFFRIAWVPATRQGVAVELSDLTDRIRAELRLRKFAAVLRCSVRAVRRGAGADKERGLCMVSLVSWIRKINMIG